MRLCVFSLKIYCDDRDNVYFILLSSNQKYETLTTV